MEVTRALTVRVFGVERVLGLPTPGEQVVTAAVGHSVIADPHYLSLRTDDAGAHLRAGILAPLGRQEGNCHEVV